VCNNGITQFYLPPTHEPYLPLLPRCKASLPFRWYSLRLPTKGWPGSVDLGGWSQTETNVLHWKMNMDTVTHPSNNRARCRGTSLMCATPLPLVQAHTARQRKDDFRAIIKIKIYIIEQSSYTSLMHSLYSRHGVRNSFLVSANLSFVHRKPNACCVDLLCIRALVVATFGSLHSIDVFQITQ